MIVVTGAAGFIGSCLVAYLNQTGKEDLILVDAFGNEEKKGNHRNKTCTNRIERDEFIPWFSNNADQVDCVFHLGARTDTTEFNKNIFDELNVNYSKEVWTICAKNNIPLIYASSAATYGLGEKGYIDDHSIVNELKPLNPYGESKNEFDSWVLDNDSAPEHWYGLKFFNVYGPNEYHKGRMASVILHAFNQIHETEGVKLFRSHNPDYEDGKQLRDFIYVKDVVSVCSFLMDNKPGSGLYNLGTGEARSFLDLANGVFSALNKEPDITFIDTPEDIRDKYQYFTEADMTKLRAAGYNKPFTSLEQGITEYVQAYLKSCDYY